MCDDEEAVTLVLSLSLCKSTEPTLFLLVIADRWTRLGGEVGKIGQPECESRRLKRNHAEPKSQRLCSYRSVPEVQPECERPCCIIRVSLRWARSVLLHHV